jgi:glycosyltransferase involved in cell wall biosynthesis
VLVLLASGTPYLPHVVGGVEINTHELALELNQRGLTTAVLSKLPLRNVKCAYRAARNFVFGHGISADNALGYSVYLSPRPWADLSGLPLPSVVVVQNGRMIDIAHAFRARGVPVVAYLHSVGFDEPRQRWPKRAEELPFKAFIANSEFTAARFRARYGIKPVVIPPVFHPGRYCAHGDRRYATFINPVREKGLDLVLELAELCPDIPFRFVKAWPIGFREMTRLKARLRTLRNVELLEPQSDMSSIYASTRVLLVPTTLLSETWGRVVSEAQFGGIPVLATDRGALPDTVGKGGVIIQSQADATVWANELMRLWTDGEYYRGLQRSALAHSRRPELEFDRQIAQFIGLVSGVVA